MREIDNKTFTEIAQIVGTSRFTISRIYKKNKVFQSMGELASIEKNNKSKLSPFILKSIKLFIKINRGIVTAKTISHFIREKYNLQLSNQSIYNALKKKLNFRRRIGGTIIPFINSTTQKQTRFNYVGIYLDFIKRGFIPISVDETGIQLGQMHRAVYVELGELFPKSHPLKEKRWNAIFAISLDGFIAYEIHLGPTTQINFLIFLYNLFEQLKQLESKTKNKYFLILDNISYHKSPVIKALITKYKIPVIFLPTYSSFMQPVEYFNHVVKQALDNSDSLSWYFFAPTNVAIKY